MNPRAAINGLLPFQGSPFNRLGTSPSIKRYPGQNFLMKFSGERGIRTLAPFRTNGFQDRLVMTASISLHSFYAILLSLFASDLYIISPKPHGVNYFFKKFVFFLHMLKVILSSISAVHFFQRRYIFFTMCMHDFMICVPAIPLPVPDLQGWLSLYSHRSHL